jgi:hypothetical protein
MPSLTHQEWKYLFDLRDEIQDDEDRNAVRRLIRRAEELEIAMRRIQRTATPQSKPPGRPPKFSPCGN